MNNYKIGDKLVCIDDRDSSNLELGYEYEITDINEYGNIQVAGEDFVTLPHFYKPSRFDTIVEYKYEYTAKDTVKTKSSTFDPSKQYKTRDGRKFRFIGFSQRENYPIIGEVLSGEIWEVLTLTESGCYYSYPEKSCYDLIEVPDKIEIKIGGIDVVVYDDRSILFNGCVASEPMSNEEIDAFIEALNTFRN
jgi:hypothetical protein